MLRYLFGSTVLLSAVIFNAPSTGASATSTPTLQTPRLKISGQTSFNNWFFKNRRKVLAGAAGDPACSRQKYGRGQLFTVDDSRLKFDIDGKTDPGMNYGMVIVLDGNTDKEKIVRENYIYFGGTWGNLFAGDSYGVQKTMAFGGYDQWGGTGFIDGAIDRVVLFTTGSVHSVDLKGDTSRDTKLTYLTPRVWGTQVGVSYTPRMEHRGEQKINAQTSVSRPKEPFDQDSIASGINFIHKFVNGFQMALSATSIFGQTHPEYKGAPGRKDTASYAFGGTFSYRDIGFSAEYGNNGRSGELKGQHLSNAGQFLDFGLSYKWGSTKFATGYYYAWRNALGGTGAIFSGYKRQKSKTRGAVASIDQKLAPGLGVYFEYSYLQMKNPAAVAEGTRLNNILSNCNQFVGPVKSNNANVFIVGSRLVF